MALTVLVIVYIINSASILSFAQSLVLSFMVCSYSIFLREWLIVVSVVLTILNHVVILISFVVDFMNRLRGDVSLTAIALYRD